MSLHANLKVGRVFQTGVDIMTALASSMGRKWNMMMMLMRTMMMIHDDEEKDDNDDDADDDSHWLIYIYIYLYSSAFRRVFACFGNSCDGGCFITNHVPKLATAPAAGGFLATLHLKD